MWVAADATTQLAAYGPILVATAGLITALIAGATRRDKAQEGRATTLDAKADTALRGLETYAERLEGEVARWTEQAARERTRAETAEQQNDAYELRIDALESELAQLKSSGPRPKVPPARGRSQRGG